MHKFNQLEGLRGAAAIVVLFSHIRLTFFPGAEPWFLTHFGKVGGTIAAAFLDGNFAVWLFWVMSALVLSARYFRTGDNATLTDATLRRYPRLLMPVAASVAIAWALHSLGLMSNVRLAEVLGQPTDSWLASFYRFEPNAWIAAKSAVWDSFFAYDKAATYNSVLWTMGPELLGSFFLFGYLAIFGKHPARTLFYVVTVIIAYKLRIYWINAFVLGSWLCDAYTHKRVPTQLTAALSSPAVILLAIPLLYFIGLPNLKGVLHLLLAVALTAIVMLSPVAHRFFCSRPLLFLGRISFGLYLIHLPLICSVAHPLYVSLQLPPLAAAWVASAVLLALSIVAGWLMWYIADRPSLHFSRAVVSLLETRIITRRDRQVAA